MKYLCNEAEFNIHLATLKRLQDSDEDPRSNTDFLSVNLRTFSCAFVSIVPKSDSVESNIYETFNGCIVKWRGVRIMNMLEGIYMYMMKRLVNKVNMLQNTKERVICPMIEAKIEKGKLVARHWGKVNFGIGSRM